MKSLVLRIRDADRALFRMIFHVKWTPLTPIMRAFTVAGRAGALWGVFAFLAYLATGLETYDLLVPWTAVAASWVIAEIAKFLFNRPVRLSPTPRCPPHRRLLELLPSGQSAATAAGAITLYTITRPSHPASSLGLPRRPPRIYLGSTTPSTCCRHLIGTATAAVVWSG